MIRIVYIIPSFESGGPNNVVLNIIRHLDKSIFTPMVVALHCTRKGGVGAKPLFEDLGSETEQFQFEAKDILKNKKKIAALIAHKYHQGNTVFHAHCMLPAIVASAMKNVTTMTTIHSISGEDFVLKYGKIKGTMLSLIYKNTLSKVSHCVAISEYMANYYRNCTKNLSIIYNGVQNKNTDISEKEREGILNELGISLDSKIFLYPAVFLPGKNHRYIIEAMRAVKRSDVYMLFAGSGLTEEGCKALAKNDDRIKFLGYQKNLDRYWSIADYLISPSMSEGMPMAVLEAVIAGKSCLLSGIKPHREILSKIGLDSSHILNIKDAHSLLHQLDNLLEKPLMPEKIKEKAMKYFSSEVMSQSYQQLYVQLSKGI